MNSPVLGSRVRSDSCQTTCRKSDPAEHMPGIRSNSRGIHVFSDPTVFLLYWARRLHHSGNKETAKSAVLLLFPSALLLSKKKNLPVGRHRLSIPLRAYFIRPVFLPEKGATRTSQSCMVYAFRSAPFIFSDSTILPRSGELVIKPAGYIERCSRGACSFS